MGRYLDIIRQVEREGAGTAETTEAPLWSLESFGRTPTEPESSPYVTVLAALRECCPDHIEPDRWLVEDGRRFLANRSWQPACASTLRMKCTRQHAASRRAAPWRLRLDAFM